MSNVITSDQKPAEIPATAARKPRPVSPLNGQPIPGGRPKGRQNRLTLSLKEAIEAACQPGACHPQGLKGWLVDRATGTLGDRQIFAGLVAKVVPAHIHTSGTGQVTINLGWLTGRNVAPDTITVHPERKSLILDADIRSNEPRAAIEQGKTAEIHAADPLSPLQSAGGEG